MHVSAKTCTQKKGRGGTNILDRCRPKLLVYSAKKCEENKHARLAGPVVPYDYSTNCLLNNLFRLATSENQGEYNHN